MTLKKRELFFAVLLSTCVLCSCEESVKSNTATLHDAEKDLQLSTEAIKLGDVTGSVRNIAKRIVDGTPWQQQNTPQPNSQRDPRVPANSPDHSRSGWIPVMPNADQFNGHSYEFHRQNPHIPLPNTKWQPAHGHNEFTGQGFHDKEDDEWYEGVSSESTKPRREKMPASPADPSDIVAKYDPASGVHCPKSDSNGIFVYPPDCKFYVTCSNGRAVVQPCAPGTLFSPDTLECDFPHKVKCYGGELADFANPADLVDGPGRKEPLMLAETRRMYEMTRSLEEPECPPHVFGVMPHPSDCAKYLQCANGNTYIMECGPGSVFNPSMSICDWPQNVKGCEGTYDESGFSDPHKPPTNYDSAGSAIEPMKVEYERAPRRVECPYGFSGLTAHPDSCNQFLQCANGITYTMNCGPGTVFNPLTSVCDWPYNVPGCDGNPYKQPSPQPNYPNYGHQGSGTPIVPTPNPGHETPNYAGLGLIDIRTPPIRDGGTFADTHLGSFDQQRPQGPLSDWNSHNHTHNHHNNHHHHGVHHHHHHHHNHSNSGNFGYGHSQHGQNGQHYPHQHNHRPERPQTNYQVPYPAIQQPATPDHNFNGHAYPYNPQGHDHNQPTPANSYRTEFESSSEEDTYPGVGQVHGHAWSEPAGRGNPPPSDRRNYGRTNDKDPSITNSESGDNKWSPPESASGSFQPSTWRGMGRGFEHRPSVPSRTRPDEAGPNIVTPNEKPYERPTNPNIHNSNTQWTANVNSFSTTNHPALVLELQPPFNTTKNVHPLRVHGNLNNTGGHYITKDLVIDQGHSRTREQHSQAPPQQVNSKTPARKDLSISESQHVMSIPLARKNTTWKPDIHFPDELNITMVMGVQVQDSTKDSPEIYDPDNRNKEFVYIGSSVDPNMPTVSIELEEDWNSSLPMPKAKPIWNQQKSVEKKFKPNNQRTKSTEDEDFGIEVETPDSMKQWKPQLFFPDKNKPDAKEDKSVVMRVNKKRPSYLLEVELAPFLDGQPPFPTHYTPQAKSASLTRDPFKPGQFTPLSGQVIRLRGGNDPSEGFVEVQGAKPGWGTVCDTRNGWTLKEANIVCKQLGYGRGAALAWQGRPKNSDVPKWIAASSVVCHGNETKFQSCNFVHKPDCLVEKDAVAVRCLPHRVAHCRKDELPHNGQCYHFAPSTEALSHSEAHDYCQRRGSRIVDIIDQPENDFISEHLIQYQPQVDSIMTAGMGFTMFNRTIWMWEDSKSAKFKFTKWWPGWLEDKYSPPVAGSRPVCIIIKRVFPCHDRPENNCKTDYFFWDVEDCASANKGHATICERPYDDVGCVYGNGNQYYGIANISSTGRQCLSWSNPLVSRSLITKVPSREARDKLKDHNYCRNPNPNKEARPWCFTGPRGEYEYCDIPYCGKILSKKSHLTGSCKPKHFECLPGECIPSPWVCDGEEDCTNGADERKCSSYINFFKKVAKHKLDGYEVEKWLNTPAKTCALRCREADFTCRSFTHQTNGNICYLSDSNVGMTGALVVSTDHDYYEMRDHTLDCEDMFVCANQKCVNKTQVCDGKNDCLDRSDEKVCTVENLGYGIRLGGANSSHEGRVEIKILGKWGQVCDDSFDMIDAGVICRELGFNLGALEVRPGGFYGNLDPPDSFMVDQLKCRGNESTIRECDFEGWGKHNCEPEEAVGVICKTDIDTCQDGQWKCDNTAMCIPTPFICDEVADCPDGSDESPQHCDAPFELRLANGSSPMEGRVEIRHHGIWGTVCDDDFSNATAKVICRSLGYGGPAMIKKDGFFGPGSGPIWLDEVFCVGNETQLYRCEHDHWGRHNCDHNEDAGVVCTAGPIPDEYESAEVYSPATLPQIDVNQLLPSECGKRPEDFDEDDELMFERVVRSSIAPRGSYPWQASIRVRGHSKSSHWCGAVVLSPLHVLTAAHCLEGYNKGTYFVRAGDYNTEIDEGTEAEANIEDYYIHEDFRNGHRLNNDIAVVLLKGRGIPLGRNVMPICLPHENIEYLSGLNCTISGFGSIEAGSSTHSRKLRFGWVPILDQSICKADYVYGQSITDGMICAGHLDGGPDTCDGDSGGPLACLHNGAFTLYGLTSWGQHCGRANKPGVYVRIAHYRKWIDQKIRESLIGR